MFIFALLIALSVADDVTRQCIIATARAQLGKPYVWGAEGPDTFDCSGLVYYSYQACGYYFDHRAWTGTLMYMGYEVYESNLEMADLVFPFEGHVQMYTENGYIIHSPRPNDYVTEEPIYSFWIARRLIEGSGGTNNGGTTDATSGTVTVIVDELNIRAAPNTSSEIVNHYVRGAQIVFDQKETNDQCTWLSYVGQSSGLRRYVCGKNPSGTCYVSPCPT